LPTSDGSPSRHVFPSPPHGSPLPGQEPSPQPPSETQVIDDVEAALANVLVVVVGGNRPPLSPEQIRDLLV
jgi:hypothetical protein